MEMPKRSKIRFVSRGTECVAWHYAGVNGACVVMAGGGGVTKEPGTDRFAARFHAAGFSVLAFDYRRQGESGGEPRQVIRVRDQMADWDAAIACAQGLPEVDPARLGAWGFSLTGGHLLRIAARGRVAVAIAQTPLADGAASSPNALRHETLSVILRFPLLALFDTIRGLLSLPPLMVPLAGPRGTVALLTTPDAQDADRALNPEDSYPGWQQTIAARSVLPIGFYRPGRAASRIKIPLMVVAAENDQSVLAAPAVRVAERAPRATLLRIPGGHYAPFLDQHDVVAETELAFLRSRLT